jgi:hypothetical protein
MTGRAVAAVVAAIALTGCHNESTNNSTPPGPTFIEGHVTASGSCHAGTGRHVALSPTTVTLLALCPLVIDLPEHRRVTLGPNSPLFRPVLRKLATPGASYGPNTACPAYADVPHKILMRSGSTWVVVDIPRDSCGHYDRALVTLLSRARGS